MIKLQLFNDVYPCALNCWCQMGNFALGSIADDEILRTIEVVILYLYIETLHEIYMSKILVISGLNVQLFLCHEILSQIFYI